MSGQPVVLIAPAGGVAVFQPLQIGRMRATLRDTRAIALHREHGRVVQTCRQDPPCRSRTDEAAGDDIGHARVLTFLGRALLEDNEHARAAATVGPRELLEKSGCTFYEAGTWSGHQDRVTGCASPGG
jgi:hypothetical protein